MKTYRLFSINVGITEFHWLLKKKKKGKKIKTTAKKILNPRNLFAVIQTDELI